MDIEIKVGQVWKSKSFDNDTIVVLATNNKHSLVGGNVPDMVNKKFDNSWILENYELDSEFNQ